MAKMTLGELRYLARQRNRQVGEPDFTDPMDMPGPPPEEKKRPWGERHPFWMGFLQSIGGRGEEYLQDKKEGIAQKKREEERAAETGRREEIRLSELEERQAAERRRLEERREDQAIDLQDPSLVSDMTLSEAIRRRQEAEAARQKRLEETEVPGYVNVGGKLYPTQKPEGPYTLSPGQELVSPEGKVLRTTPPKPEKPSREEQEDAALAELEATMTPADRLSWDTFTLEQKRYILKELYAAQ